MGPGRTLLRAIFLGAIAHQLAEALLQARRPPWFPANSGRPEADDDRTLARDRRALRAAIGLALAALYRPRLLTATASSPPGVLRHALDLASDALLVALSARFIDEGLARLRAAPPSPPTSAAPEEDDVSARIFPGISVRYGSAQTGD